MKKLILLTALLCLVVFAVSVQADPKPKDVNIVNQPTVYLGDTADVNVLNEPLQVEVNSSEREPFQTEGSLTLKDNEYWMQIHEFTPDTEKRLVIDNFNAILTIAQGGTGYIEITTTVNGSSVVHTFPFDFRQSFASTHDFMFLAKTVTLFADPDTKVSIHCTRSTDTRDSYCSCKITGYLEPVPSP